VSLPTFRSSAVWPDSLRGRPALAHVMQAWAGAVFTAPVVLVPALPKGVRVVDQEMFCRAADEPVVREQDTEIVVMIVEVAHG